MSRWGSQLPNKEKYTYGRDTPKRKNSLSSRTSFLTGELANTDHHEPPIYELSIRGRSSSLDALPTSHAVHALIHRVRFDMFGDRRDYDAYCAQASEMSEDESDMYEVLIESPDKIEQIKNEIRRRRRMCGLG